MTERRARRRPGENRERLIEAGLTEFGLSGYHGTSTARIAARAGVPQPHVYANFRTKQELFFACVESAAQRIRDRAASGGSSALGSDRVGATSDSSVALTDSSDARLLLQASAAAAVPELRPLLNAELGALHLALGEHAYAEVLAQGAAALRGGFTAAE
ncbi:TetR family transcriptional regulator [Leucobacter luti]|uniref:TetR/AcrR family transcriptional regulator n=1 Tax=Leucobacter luti TaxID=340320 RepID=UPI00104A41B4|nr:TetR/AcrR family transcriptional regulator [Leucobacter luti]MCW2287719.1 AcrR family transcriptional regulator [Leucobacter luti]TCK46116.1 TetR family transcriptional regulator [Leucobacter luti]